MRHRGSAQERSVASAAALDALYEQRRLRVDRACEKMQATVASSHDPAVTRRRAVELASALRDATATASQSLGMARVPVALSRRRRRHKAVRTVSPDVRRWSVELVRLSRIDVWLRRTTLDELGVHVPALARVPSWPAATPPSVGVVEKPDGTAATIPVSAA